MSNATYIFNEYDCDLAQIEEEILRLTARIQDLKAIRNRRCLPISRLPPELLLEIMLVYQYSHEADDIDNSTYTLFGSFLPRSYRWISISHVCRHWRAIALNSPLLWTSIHIPCASTEWVDELLRRSHPTPISVLDLHDFKSTEAIINSLSPFSSKHGMGRPVHRLHLSYPRGDPSCIAPLELNHLKELTVDGRVLTMGEASEQLKSFIAYFAASSFQLTSLILRYSTWDPRLLHRTLTTLNLSGRWARNVMGWDEFLSALASMQQLRHLALKRLLSELRPSPANQDMLVTLPRLESFSLLNHEMPMQVKFLRSVSIPPVATIDFESYARSVSDFIAANSTFSRTLSVPTPSHLHRFLALRVESCDSRHSIYMMMDPVNRDASSTKRPYQRMLKCHAYRSGPTSYDSFTQGVNELLKSLSLSHIQYLRLESSGNELAPLINLINTLATLPALSTLSIDEVPESAWVTCSLVSALPTCDHDHSNGISTSSAFPGLSLCQACKSFSDTWFPKLQKLKYVKGLEHEDQRLDSVRKILSFIRQHEGKSNDWRPVVGMPKNFTVERIVAFVR